MPNCLATLVGALSLPRFIADGNNAHIKHDTASLKTESILSHTGDIAKLANWNKLARKGLDKQGYM
jgi:hypothetical protein